MSSKVEKLKKYLRSRIYYRFANYRYPSAQTVSGRDMNNYFGQVATCYATLTNPFEYYRRLIESLLNERGVKLLPLCELLSSPAEGKRVIGLRHDVDADPITALRCARHLARVGVGGSFYLLHTAPYYGDFYGEYFIRNPQLAEWVLGFLIAGCELGIHNDCLRIYMDRGMNGAEALKQELIWLRGMGAHIRGTVAHNSGPIYGAENSEIFSGRVLWHRTVKTKGGKSVPLGCITERDVRLTYEGSFAKKKDGINETEARKFFSNSKDVDVRSETWMKRYLLENPCLDWETDYQFWLVGRDTWVVAGKYGGDALFAWNVGINRVLEIVRGLPEGSRSIMIVHPEYVRGDG